MRDVILVINLLLDLLIIAIVVRALLSWFYQVGRDPFTKLLVDITEPLLAPVRALMSRFVPIPIDFSPIVVILLLTLMQQMLVQSARGF